jgi:hypothetical protein
VTPRRYTWSELAHMNPQNAMGRHFIEAKEHDRIILKLSEDFYKSNQTISNLEEALKMYTDKDARRKYQNEQRRQKKAWENVRD